ncbi:hypothetical protein BU23DRAFT_136246 [Bimuria novae-zelandiae CBS 107.79]|uniref:Uncharacterized protein n=1 Tax=Bimuria novae-zelandiae CBS 107.79 TaxID=1447943 RepID=A0A6A5VEA2_9PLEO|nr:hypothetical protein BU23DRAFT_136246 [Bimuria novae-zelandiae CBS 107.79]
MARYDVLAYDWVGEGKGRVRMRFLHRACAFHFGCSGDERMGWATSGTRELLAAHCGGRQGKHGGCVCVYEQYQVSRASTRDVNRWYPMGFLLMSFMPTTSPRVFNLNQPLQVALCTRPVRAKYPTELTTAQEFIKSPIQSTTLPHPCIFRNCLTPKSSSRASSSTNTSASAADRPSPTSPAAPS